MPQNKQQNPQQQTTREITPMQALEVLSRVRAGIAMEDGEKGHGMYRILEQGIGQALQRGEENAQALNESQNRVRTLEFAMQGFVTRGETMASKHLKELRIEAPDKKPAPKPKPNAPKNAKKGA